jgi:MFS family permease
VNMSILPSIASWLPYVALITWHVHVVEAYGISMLTYRSGNEIGPFRAVEESTLAHLTPADVLPDIFAWYIVAGTVSIAAGTIVSGWVVQHLQVSQGWDDVSAYRIIFWIYAALGLCKFLLAVRLSQGCEVYEHNTVEESLQEESEETDAFLQDDSEETDAFNLRERREEGDRRDQSNKPNFKGGAMSISKKTWFTLIRLCLLFAVDSLASGLVPL